MDKLVNKTVKFSSIIVDAEWNPRRTLGGGVSGAEGASTKGDTFDAFVADIRERGLQHPLTVIQQGNKYFLVAGFRRSAALALIHEGRDFDVPVMVSSMTMEGAREANMLENLTQRRLSPAETARGITAWKTEHKVTLEVIAGRLGLVTSYVSNLHRTYTSLEASILKSWEEGTSGLTTDNFVKLAALPRDKQVAEYNAMRGARGKKEADKEARREAKKAGLPAPAKEPTAIGRKGLHEAIAWVNANVKDKDGKGIILEALSFACGDSTSLRGYDPRAAREADELAEKKRKLIERQAKLAAEIEALK